MQIELLNPIPQTPLHPALKGIFRNASRVQLAVAFLTGPGAATFRDLVPAGPAGDASRVVASIRWPTSLPALGKLSAEMPRGVYLHRGLFLPEETNHDRPLMHSKVVYVEHAGSAEVDILVGSHNWTGQALAGNNLEATVHVRCQAGEPFAADVRRHLDGCFAGSELFDRGRMEDYLAIQAALHGGPPRGDTDGAGFVKESVVVIHAEEEPGLTEGLRELDLYLPIRNTTDDGLFGKDQLVHLYVYERGRLFTRHDPSQSPALYTGQVEMSNRPTDPAPRTANCTISNFDRPELGAWTGPIPPAPELDRQLVAVMRPERRGRILFYHGGGGEPRFRRVVAGRPLTADEAGRLGEGTAVGGREPAQADAYTEESIEGGEFVFEVPADPEVHCVISLPSRGLYPADAEADFAARFRAVREDVRSRARIVINSRRTPRQYVYKCTHRPDLESGLWE